MKTEEGSEKTVKWSAGSQCVPIPDSVEALIKWSVRGRDYAQIVGCSESEISEVVYSLTLIRFKYSNSRLRWKSSWGESEMCEGYPVSSESSKPTLSIKWGSLDVSSTGCTSTRTETQSHRSQLDTSRNSDLSHHTLTMATRLIPKKWRLHQIK